MTRIDDRYSGLKSRKKNGAKVMAGMMMYRPYLTRLI
jgi:hypothetical protein